MKRTLLFLSLPVIWGTGTPLWASGGHYVVDDAAIVERCQLEASYTNRRGEGWTTSVAPSCQPIDKLEVMFEATRIKESGDHGTAVTLQLKRLLTDPQDGFGAALNGGAVYLADDGELAGYYALLPATLSFAQGATLLHLNIGWERMEAPRRNLTIWGLAADQALTAHLRAVTEVYGDDRGASALQAGLRFASVSDHKLLDLGYGRNLQTGGDDWYTIGFIILY